MENGKWKMENGGFRIVIEDLSFEAIIGILESERETPQLVVVNAKIDYEDKKNYIDYAKVCDMIQEIIINGKFKLIEDAIEVIENELRKTFPQMKRLYLSIKKPEILKNALVGVEILRKY